MEPDKINILQKVLLKLQPELGKFSKDYYLNLIRVVPLTKEQLNHSNSLDIHLWSDHPDVDRLVESILDELHSGRKKESWRIHLKVILLNLYCNWVDDPNLKTAYHRSSNYYKAGSVYNELGLSKTLVKVVDTLSQASMLYQRKGFFDRVSRLGRISRIWPTDMLLAKFRNVEFSVLDIYPSANRVSVILRKEDIDSRKQTNIEYEMTEEIRQMTETLSSYNHLLRHTFIDIPTLGNDGIDIANQGAPEKLLISQRRKFVRRVFNRGSFDCGGRFFGGWWQRCPKSWRQLIFIDDQATNEIDFAGLHIVLLYAMQGVNYWEEKAVDPYEIGDVDFLDEGHSSREVAKSLLLMLLNAKTKNKGYSAFRADQQTGSPLKKLTNEQLSTVHEKLIEKHPRMAEYLGADIGITLMNLDSKITEIIIYEFTKESIPVLTVHDSYIVPQGLEDQLKEVMCDAFERVTSIRISDFAGIALKEQTQRISDLEERIHNNKKNQCKARIQKQIEMLNELKEPQKSQRYINNLNKFMEYINK